MGALRDLEHDVWQYLSTLANVREVQIKSSMPLGKKRLRVRTVIKDDSSENQNRVRRAQEDLVDRHRNVDFLFNISHPAEV
jgi:hypothetical protein